MKNVVKLLFIFFLLIIYACTTSAQEAMATIRLINGTLQIRRAASSKWEIATLGMMIFPGDQLKTGENSKAAILFTDATQVKMNANSLLTIDGKREEKSLTKKLKLKFGEIWGKVTHQDSPMQIETPTSVASVKGTEFDIVIIEEDGEIMTYLFVFEGAMELLNELGQLIVTPGEPGAAGDEAPPEIVEVEEEQIPDWQEEIEPQWNLLIEPESETVLVNQEFALLIKATNMSDGEIDPNYDKTVALSADSPTMTFSADGGQTWLTSLTFTLPEGEITILAKDTQTGTPLVGAAADDTSPGFTVLSIVEQGQEQEGQIKTMEIEVLDDEGNVKKVIIKYTN